MENGRLDRKAYDGLLSMFNSPDSGNWTMGIEILENIEDIKPSLVWILLLMKNSHMSPPLESYCTKTASRLRELGWENVVYWEHLAWILTKNRLMNQLFLLIQEYEKEKEIEPLKTSNINHGGMLTS